MSEFVEHIREDGTVEYRNVRHDELLAEAAAIPAEPPLTITAEDIAEAALNSLRHVRDQKLAETDWWANSDLTMTAEQTAYRQALRDITDTYTSLDDVVWPTKP